MKQTIIENLCEECKHHKKDHLMEGCLKEIHGKICQCEKTYTRKKR